MKKQMIKTSTQSRTRKQPSWKCFYLKVLTFLITVVLSASLFAQVAPVNPPLGGFNINGGLKANTSAGDWVKGTGSGGFVLSDAGVPVNSSTSGLKTDLYNSNSDSVFTTGSKFNDYINALHWTQSSAPDKNDINNAMYHVSSNPATSGAGAGDQWVFIAGDRLSTNGTSWIDFEFLQGTVTMNSNGTFTGSGTAGGRTLGDIIISMSYTNGGAIASVTIYKWSQSGSIYFWDSTGSYKVTNAYARTNTTNEAVPFGAFGSTTYQPFAFVEAAIDITQLITSQGGNCPALSIKTLWIKTKASASSTAALKDFITPISVSFNFGGVSLAKQGPLCLNASPVTLSGTPSGGTFSGPGVSGNQFDPANAGSAGEKVITYTVQYSATCTKQDTIHITVNPLPTAQISGTTTVCKDATAPNITFTGAGGTAPYTFTYNINGGTNTTVTTSSGNSVTVAQSTGTAGTYTYNLVSVQDANCSQTQTGSATVTVRPTPTASISGGTTVCQNATAPTVTFNNSGDLPITVTYSKGTTTGLTINVPAASNGTPGTNTVTQATGTAGSFVYTITSVAYQTTPNCPNNPGGSTTVIVRPTPTANISGGTTVCKDATASTITFSNSGTLPVTVTYSLNSTTGLTINVPAASNGTPGTNTVSQATGTAGSFVYTITGVAYQDNPTCTNNPGGSATIVVRPTPSAGISGGTTVCKGGTAPNVTFTNNSTLAVTVSYTLNSVAQTPINIAASGTQTVSQPTSTAGTYVYTITNVAYQDDPGCSNNPGGTATVVVRPTPTATIGGTTTVCQNATAPSVTFTNTSALAVTINYTLNNVAQTALNIAANSSQTVSQPTATAGTYVYTITGVAYQDNPGCSTNPGGSATITVSGKPNAPTVCIVQPSLCGPAKGIINITPGQGYQYSIDGGTTWCTNNVFCNIDAGSNPSMRVKTGDGCISDLTTCAQASICSTTPVCQTPNCASGSTLANQVPVTKTSSTLSQEITLNAAKSQVVAAPNPFSDRIRFSIKSAISGQGSLELYNMLGQKVKTVFQGYVSANQVQSIEYAVPGSQRANLIYVFRVGNEQTSGKLIGLK